MEIKVNVSNDDIDTALQATLAEEMEKQIEWEFDHNDVIKKQISAFCQKEISKITSEAKNNKGIIYERIKEQVSARIANDVFFGIQNDYNLKRLLDGAGKEVMNEIKKAIYTPAEKKKGKK